MIPFIGVFFIETFPEVIEFIAYNDDIFVGGKVFGFLG
jgi:hypothetical protein